MNNTLLKVRVKIVFDWDITPQSEDGALKASEGVLAYLDQQVRDFRSPVLLPVSIYFFRSSGLPTVPSFFRDGCAL